MVGQKEKEFWDALENLFVGIKVEGQSGYVNLMRIKANYFNEIAKQLRNDIDNVANNFPNPNAFKEELYDKLYTFFRRYFSESGSIFFRFTPVGDEIYDKIYTNDKDVVMFWKTHMLYYVKTENIIRSIDVDLGNNLHIHFDASEVEHKKANEKRDFVFTLDSVETLEDGDNTITVITLKVTYSEHGRKTKLDEIVKTLQKEHNINISVDSLEKAISAFKRQGEIDYFINKDAEKFLKEQFDLWVYQYVYSGNTVFNASRLKQLKAIRDIAYKIIDFIAQFENELVKIWRKPKFVLNSNYVITLDRIYQRPGGIDFIRKLIDCLKVQCDGFLDSQDDWQEYKSKYKSYRERFENVDLAKLNQIIEWYLLDLIDESFNPEDILELQRTMNNEPVLNQKYQFLPIDTRYFKDLEPELLSLFDDLDKSLDGWLIKSDNWQALNTILAKFKGKVQTIYIDPPFNTGSNEFTMYINKFLDSAWITMMENRLRLAKEFLKNTGSIFVRIDYHGNHYVRFLMDDIFGKENFRNEIVVKRVNYQGTNVQKRFNPAHETLFFYVKNIEKNTFNILFKPRERTPKWVNAISPKENKEQNIIIINGRKFVAPKGHHWRFSQEKFDELYRQGRLRIKEAYEYIDIFGNKQKGILQYLEAEKTPVDSLFLNIPSYSFTTGFPTENSEQLLKRVIQASSNPGDLVMDFFLGSGTTTAVAHKLGRKWIGVEMGEHFYTVVIPRMKKVLAYDPSGISKDPDIKESYNKDKAGGFFKYYELEQYEDVLRRVVYVDDPFYDPTKPVYDQYVFGRDFKLLRNRETGQQVVEINGDDIEIHLDGLYRNIDLPETLSNLLGKRIKKIDGNTVSFEDETQMNLENLDYRIIKPLIWWD